jgi:NADH-quinone oxidoreductase subunit L
LVGGGALAALPFITVGFYSKDAILWEVWASGHRELFWAGIVGAFMTSIYTFRLIWLVFHGEAKTHAHPIKGVSYWLPLGALLVVSTAVGALIHPPLAGVLPQSLGSILEETGQAHDLHLVEMIAMAAALGGLVIGALLFTGERRLVTRMRESAIGAGLAHWWTHGWGFDALYDLIFSRPFLWIARLIGRDPIDRVWSVVPAVMRAGNGLSTSRQTGSLRGYAVAMALGVAVLLMTLMVIQVMGK